MLDKLAALLFSIAVPLSPILIVVFAPAPMGGIFVVGFLFGAALILPIFLGVLKAASILYSGMVLDTALGITGYFAGVILISLAAAAWSIFVAT